MERIHIVAPSPRSGTTLLSECMVNAFEIDAFEPHESPLSQHRRGAKIYLTKRPVDLYTVGARLRVDRHFHVICMIRDPRDVVVSVHGANPDAYWAPLSFWKNRVDIVRRLGKHQRFLVVRYEDLVREPDHVQERLAAALPFLKARGTFSDFHTTAAPSGESRRALGSLRAISPASIGNWRNHRPRLKGQLSIHGPIAGDLIEFGYENDDAWLAALDGVEADLSPSHWPEHMQVRIWRFRRMKYAEAAKIAAMRLFNIDAG